MHWIKNFNPPLRSLISVLIIGLLLTRMNIHEILRTAFDINLFYLSAALLFMMAQIIALAWRWHLLINMQRHITDFATSMRITIASLLANLLLFTSISGVFVRIALAVQEGAKLTHAIFVTVIDRIMTFAALALVTLAFLPGLAPHVEGKTFTTLCLAAGILTVTAFVFTPLFFHDYVRRFAYGNRKIAKIYKNTRTLLSRPALFGKVLAVSLAAQLFYFVAVYALTIPTEANITLVQLLSVLLVIALVAALPISIGGWGVRESAFIVGLGFLGVPAETAFSVSVQVGILSMLSTVVAGVPGLLGGNVQKLFHRSLRFAPEKIKPTL
ncbi:MAG: flippase-like domain-containing protein [Rhodospirillales bacterium]|nr:flippase-like domain-containing protein [Rhodospirillales bacterium]